jgi:hypothetical protein
VPVNSDVRFPKLAESLLKEKILESLKGDFHILEEVPGHHPIYGKDVRIDLLLRAKNHLCNAGFTTDWFGVECKWISGVNGQTAKTTKAVWQSITYAQSEFIVSGQKIRPIFVALFTPELEPTIERHINSLFQLALYGNVAKMYFYRDGNWGIKFASIYARSENGSFYVSERQLPKYRAGSIA